jgi:serine protease AprX
VSKKQNFITTRVSWRVNFMHRAAKTKEPNRDQRSSAAWGKRVGAVVLLLVAEVTVGQDPRGPIGKFAPDLVPVVARAQKNAESQETAKIIVQYQRTPQAKQEGRVQRLGARLNARLGLVKSIALTVPTSALTALAADPEVVAIHADHPLKGMDSITNAVVNISSAWNAGYNGSGIGVAIIDSGINDSHPDLWDAKQTHSRVVYHQDFTGTPTTNSSGGKYDLYGHGTHVAGIVGGNGYLSGGEYSGVAPAINLVDLRALDQNGDGSDSTVIAAIQKAISLQNTYNIQVINLSLGRGISESYTQDPLCQAVESAWQAGIVVVVAAGNYGRTAVDGIDGYGTVTAPGNDPFVITVGAMNSNGSPSQSAETMTTYTSKGPTMFDHVVKPDIMAPGNGIVSLAAPGATLEADYPAQLVNGSNGLANYFTLSGTSMAAPVVSGAAALILEQNSNLTPDQVKARLMQTSYQSFPNSSVITVTALNQTFTEYYDLFSVGTGLLDMEPALSDNMLAPSNVGAALSPSVSYNASNNTVTLADGNSSVPASKTVWGSSREWWFSNIWVDVNGNTAIAPVSTIPWNDDDVNAFSVVWGTSTSSTSVVWGTSTDATSVVWGTTQSGSSDQATLAIRDPQ